MNHGVHRIQQGDLLGCNGGQIGWRLPGRQFLSQFSTLSEEKEDDTFGDSNKNKELTKCNKSIRFHLKKPSWLWSSWKKNIFIVPFSASFNSQKINAPIILPIAEYKLQFLWFSHKLYTRIASSIHHSCHISNFYSKTVSIMR